MEQSPLPFPLTTLCCPVGLHKAWGVGVVLSTVVSAQFGDQFSPPRGLPFAVPSVFSTLGSRVPQSCHLQSVSFHYWQSLGCWCVSGYEQTSRGQHRNIPFLVVGVIPLVIHPNGAVTVRAAPLLP